MNERTVQHPTGADRASFDGAWRDKSDGFAEHVGSAELYWRDSKGEAPTFLGFSGFMDIRHKIQAPASTKPAAPDDAASEAFVPAGICPVPFSSSAVRAPVLHACTRKGGTRMHVHQ